jgi:hypothetical protein
LSVMRGCFSWFFSFFVIFFTTCKIMTWWRFRCNERFFQWHPFRLFHPSHLYPRAPKTNVVTLN